MMIVAFNVRRDINLLTEHALIAKHITKNVTNVIKIGVIVVNQDTISNKGNVSAANKTAKLVSKVNV